MRTHALFISSCLLGLTAGPMFGDTLTFPSTNAAAGAAVQLPFYFTNTHQIVGMQFDLAFPPAQVEAGSAVAASATTNHAAESREVTAGTRRIVVYSTSNQLLPGDLVLNVPLTLKEGAPAGGPALSVSNIVLTNKLGQTFAPTINRSAVDAWKMANFTEAERNDPSIVGDDKDPDGDGLGNLLEFLMGGNPKLRQASHKLQPAYGLNPSDNHRYLSMIFRVGKNAPDGTLTIQGSQDLVNWSTTGIQITPTGAQDTTSIEYKAAIQVDGLKRQFLRITGARNPVP